MYIILTNNKVKSTDKFCDFEMEFDINTAKQLRQNSEPNVWEVGWIDLGMWTDFTIIPYCLSQTELSLERKIVTAAQIL